MKKTKAPQTIQELVQAREPGAQALEHEGQYIIVRYTDGKITKKLSPPYRDVADAWKQAYHKLLRGV